MTLAAREGLASEELSENWRIAVDALGCGTIDALAVAQQVHGNGVLEVTRAAGPLAVVGEADGLWTGQTGLILAVRTADCVPVLLAAPSGVAVAHAGWRGVVAQVVQATVRALCEGTGCKPADVSASIGPCISGDAYEVGAEVVHGLTAAGLAPNDFLHPQEGPKAHVDLGRAVDAQLRAVGVKDVSRLNICTLRDPRFHSHRRDGKLSGRNAGMVVRCGG